MHNWAATTLALLAALLLAVPGSQAASAPGPRLVASEARDFRWPDRRVAVLVDPKSLNASERRTLDAVFDQLERKTCLQVARLTLDEVNPFSPARGGRNFLYLFKSQLGAGNRAPSMGLSSFGCVGQGRQALVLTDMAFKWPELVLRYHIMRSLGVERVERPDGRVRRLLNMLPLSQKITSDYSPPAPSTVAMASGPVEYPAYFVDAPASPAPNYLSESDLAEIKRLYDCPDYQDRLSARPPGGPGGPGARLSELLDDGASAVRGAEPSTSELESSAANKWDGAAQAPADPLQGSPTNTSNEGAIEGAPGAGAMDRMIADLLEAEGNQTSIEHADMSESATRNTTAATEAPDNTAPPTEQQGAPSGSEKKPKLDAEFEKLDSLFHDEPSGKSECKPLESCPLAPTDGPFDANGDSLQRERPMLLKLDDFHASDPQLQQANQMKLSQLSNDSLATYRLMNNPAAGVMDLWSNQQQQQQQQQPVSPPKSEMLISFEQSQGAPSKDPIAALASSQVLKLCSCQCQTMTPSGGGGGGGKLPTPTQNEGTPAPVGPPPSPDTPAPQTDMPTLPTFPTFPTYPPFSPFSPFPVFPTSGPLLPTDDYDYSFPHGPSTEGPPVWPPVTMLPPWPTAPPAGEEQTQPTETTSATPSAEPATETNSTTEAPESTSASESESESESESPSEGESSSETSAPTTSAPAQGESTTGEPLPLLSATPCDQVEWVKPNKTVYASARIVWDVDRGNQNYFLCNNELNGELIPGKTHGFSCKISQEGKAYEAHRFNVLTKPESVNLAWVQRNSNSFGRTNWPVVGGYSKTRDPYIVSRCLVKDENNDVITLIGYINNHGVGWFPFDDIQIECSQYDVLACVN